MSNDTIRLQRAEQRDVPVLARLNLQLIRDEGHRNAMTDAELVERMQGWLSADYEANLIIRGSETVGYALYRVDSDAIYLRQFFVCGEFRRHGVGRRAIELLRTEWKREGSRVRLEVLIKNDAGRAFWRAVGFSEYCVTMESEL